MIEPENIFASDEEDLRIYNGQAMLNETILFFYDDEDETDYDFPAYSSAFFRVYNSRGGKLIKNFTTQVSRSSNALILNCSVLDMTFTETGKRYYEIGYVRSGGYDIILRFGNGTII